MMKARVYTRAGAVSRLTETHTSDTPVASYTYDAFGRTISQSGLLADTFSFRYSTKYFDPETGLYYYGYRYYSPELRRWLTRDPIEEDGGINLYEMCENDAVTECRVWVYMQIFISSSLDKSSQTSGRKYIIKPHVINGKASNAYSKTLDKDATYRVLWDPILAHERGHASAYLAMLKSKFEDAARRFPNELSPSQQEEIKNEYRCIYKEVEYEILKGADDPERTWYEQHGFSIRDLEGGEYEASN